VAYEKVNTVILIRSILLTYEFALRIYDSDAINQAGSLVAGLIEKCLSREKAEALSAGWF